MGENKSCCNSHCAKSVIKIFNNLAQRKSSEQKTVIAFKIDILCKE